MRFKIHTRNYYDEDQILYKAKGLECISCADLSPVSFGSYDEYREFVLSARRWKDARDKKNLEAKRRRIQREEEERSREKEEADERAAKKRGSRS